MEDSNIPMIVLLDREEENFYQLGVRDKDGFLPAYHSLLHNLGNFSGPIKKLLHGIVEQTCAALLNKHPQLKNNLQAYADGLEMPLKKVYAIFILPEILSAPSFFMPNIIGSLLGCSSVFFRPSDRPGISHFRLLDFTVPTFAENAQTVLFQFPRQRVFFFSSKGMPYPALTAMNESGLTLALHQKPSKYFQYQGTPIFEVAKLIITEARDRKDIEDIIGENPTMTGWGFYCCLNDEILAIDLLGKEHWIKSYTLEEGQARYFCNERPPHPDFQRVIPFGLDPYNCMRRESMETYLAQKSQEGPLNEDIILKGLTRPLGAKGAGSANWKHSALSAYTIDSCMMNPLHGTALRMAGPAPKIFPQGHHNYQSCFSDNPQVRISPGREEKRLQHYYQGLSHLGQCTYYYQKKNIHALFHSLQMAEEYFKGWPEQNVVRLFFLAFQYIFIKSHGQEAALLDDFERLLDKLPDYLNQQCKLFILRLYKLLDLRAPELTLEHQHLKSIWATEVKLKSSVLRAKRFLYAPRIEVLDIIYPFS